MADVERLGLCAERRNALDFGCGVGRLTAPLAKRFDRAIGVDVSATMLDNARRLHRSLANCHFQLNDADDLAQFADASFDVVLSLFVLQHLESTALIETFLGEMARVLAPGGALVVQLCVEFQPHRPPLPPWRSRRGIQARAAILLRRIGVPPGILYRTLDWVPEMTMLAEPHERTRAVLESAGGRIVEVSDPDVDAGGTVHRTYFVTR